MREDNTPVEDLNPASLALGGAAVGAGFGGLIGAVVGWIMGAQVTATPQIGPVVGQWVLPSTLVGLLAGVAIGALIGALAAISSVRQKPTAPRAKAIVAARLSDELSVPAIEDLQSPESKGEPADVAAASSLGATEIAPDEVESVPTAPAASEAPPETGPVLKTIPRRRRRIKPSMYAGETPLAATASSADTENDGPLHASNIPLETPSQDASDVIMEATDVNDEEKGRNPNTFTGTEEAIDPETGAVGTAGTPVTTGYGVSGSTIGTGSRRRQNKQESSDFRGATPDTRSYDRGGRSSTDASALKEDERDSSVVDRNSDAGLVEASIPREPEGRDVYEQSEGYVESLERDTTPPSPAAGTQESAGTNIPGTGDPRGLGDNTDGQ